MPEDLQEPVVYRRLAQVPEGRKTLNGARLTLDQVNRMTQRAYTGAVDRGDGTIVPDWGGAKAEMRQTAAVDTETNTWVDGGSQQPLTTQQNGRSRRGEAPAPAEAPVEAPAVDQGGVS